MEDLERNNTKEKISKVTSLLILLIIIISMCVSLYYNYTLQNQIYERDEIIKDLTYKDSLLNQIMDIEYDSAAQTTSYSYRVRDGKILKYNVLADELDKTKFEYELMSVKHNKIANENTQNIDDYNSLTKSYNSLYTDYSLLNNKYNSLIDEFNKFVNFQKSTIETYKSTADSLSSFKTIVSLIQSNYHVNYEITKTGKTKKVSINADKLDSALVLLPYFRDRLKLDENGKVWTIKTGK